MIRAENVRLRFEGALVLSTLAVLCAYKLYVAWPNVGPALVGFAVEAALAWTIWQLAERAAGRATWLGRALFYPALLTLALCSAAHAFYFESAAERRFSLLEVGLSGVLYFFAHVLPARGFVMLSGVLLLSAAGALLVRRSAGPLWLGELRAYAALLALTALGLWFTPRAPSPVVDAAADVWERLRTRTVRPLAGAPRFAAALLDRSRNDAGLAGLASPFKKVLVLVMETMTTEKLELERPALPAATFVKAALPHVHRYERYFPNNQDSRTGMLGMLSSRFIPYEAYSEFGRDHYMYLGERSSLADQMRELGFETAFAVSQNELELVVGDLPWQHLIHLDDTKLAQARERGLLCFVPYEFEHSCEDRALLPEVLAFLDAHERAFLYQEFIWGHASSYNEASGKTNTAYYSSYVDAIIEHLRARGTLDETLIVLTSDHGFRDTALQNRLSVYRIPLWFYAPSFQARTDDRLFSHLDFKDLLHHERSLGAAPVADRPFTMIVGPTGASLLAVVTRELGFLLLKQRGDEAALLDHARFDARGRPLGAGPAADAPAYLRLFEDYRRGFDAAAHAH